MPGSRSRWSIAPRSNGATDLRPAERSATKVVNRSTIERSTGTPTGGAVGDKGGQSLHDRTEHRDSDRRSGRRQRWSIAPRSNGAPGLRPAERSATKVVDRSADRTEQQTSDRRSGRRQRWSIAPRSNGATDLRPAERSATKVVNRSAIERSTGTPTGGAVGDKGGQSLHDRTEQQTSDRRSGRRH